MDRFARCVALLASACLVLVGCGGEPAAEDGPGVRVVATTAILGDMVRNVVADQGTVEVVIEAGVDPHAFEPSAADADQLRRADLVIANGLQLEAGLTDAIEAAERDGVPILRVAEHLDPIPFAGQHADEEHADEGHVDEEHTDEEHEEHGERDPHFWFDPVRVADGVTLIGERLAEVAPEATEALTANAEAYRGEVLRLHERIQEILAAVPDSNRTLVTNHDSLGYLADRYDFDVIGTVVPGGTTLAEASGRDLEELAETIREAGVPAIFVETTAPRRLAEAVSQELDGGIEIVELYTGSLGAPDSEAGSYLGMMETDARRIADGLTT